MTPQKLRIMIIDDEECIRDSLALHLTDLGHEVLTFDTPTLCPAFRGHDCDSKGPCADIILVDQNMPGLEGLEYLRALTMHGCHVLPPNRIIMTGNVTDDIEAEVRKMGCQVIQKPLRLETLEAIIDKAKIFIPADRKLSDLD